MQIRDIHTPHQKVHRRETSQIGVQIKSLQALFDPRTLHEKCCSDKSGKAGNTSAKTPLRKRKLPPSFFKEPRHSVQENVLLNPFSLQSNEYSLSVNELSVENGPILPTDTIESILGQTDFHDLLIGSWNDGSNNRNASVCSAYEGNSGTYSPESYSDSSDGSCSVSPNVQELRMCEGNIETSDYIPVATVYEQSYDTSMPSECLLSGQTQAGQVHQQIFPTFDRESTNLLANNEAFLPLLNEPLDRFECFSSDCVADDITNIQTGSGVLPAFPQAFYGQHSPLDNSHDTIGSEMFGWKQTPQLKPCYTYL